MPRRPGHQIRRVPIGQLNTEPPRLEHGQERRHLRALVCEDADAAIVRARAFPWWPAVARDERPFRAGDWWLWIVETARLP